MKKILLFMAAAAMMGGCAKNDSDSSVIAPVRERVEIGVATDGTKASYDASLKAYWETGDKIVAVMGYGTVQGETLDIQSGSGSANAVFAGEITIRDLIDPRYIHFAYPDTAVLESVGDAESATTCTFTVAAEQDGKWSPFLCASSAEKARPSKLSGITFGKSLNAAFGVRVFAADGTTPKQLQSVKIEAANNITGTLSATTAVDGSFADAVFAVDATGNTITATNPQYTTGVDGAGRTYYEYRFEVLPVVAGDIKITVTAADGAVLSRTMGKSVTFTANKRAGVNISWASVSVEGITSWYEDSCNSGVASSLDGRKIYVNNVKIAGVDADAAGVSESGVRVTDASNNVSVYKNTDGGTSFSKEIAVVGGTYRVQPYAVINGTEYTAAEQSIIVTSVLGIGTHNIWTSYNHNYAVSKQNSGVDNDKIYANVALSGDDASYAASNLVSTVALVYGSTTTLKSGDKSLVGVDFTTDAVAKTQYADCRLLVTLANASGKTFTLTSPAYTMNVTGIPYSINFTNGSPDGWTTNNTANSPSPLGDYLRLVYGTAWIISPRFVVPTTCDVFATINAGAYRTAGTYNPNIYISVSNTGVAGGTATQLSGKNAIGLSYQDISRDLQIGAEDNNSHICIYSSGDKPGLATNTAGIMVKMFSITYR